ncbi:DNA repair RAD52-like protein 2, chloroplastic isoform X2 [Cryptomeria japonica]|uniref:DNA repair RAD52-like protein 2, chloroplastic isoform X2 n=1 Tax=Cryptomeria japonica TaxID=3369 RepID=UPI0027D9FCA5|nr:DNA repair RAD52-like protein 2, chloroplastic isoform X2 [Cryptomeria japonica]
MEAVRSIHAPAPAQSLTISKSKFKSAQSLSRRSEFRSPRLQGARFLTIASAGNSNSLKKAVPNSNYVVPLDNSAANSSSCITRPLVEILRDLNKRVPDKVVKTDGLIEPKYIPWYHANRMLSFYAPGWCGELRNVTFSADGRTVSVVYRVTIRGSDGECFLNACFFWLSTGLKSRLLLYKK